MCQRGAVDYGVTVTLTDVIVLCHAVLFPADLGALITLIRITLQCIDGPNAKTPRLSPSPCSKYRVPALRFSERDPLKFSHPFLSLLHLHS